MKSEFRRLPSVDKLLSDSRVRDLESSHSRNLVVEVVRQVLEESRQLISRGEPAPSADSLAASVSGRVRALAEPSLLPVINATGVIIHTNLGRAPLSWETMAAMEQASLATPTWSSTWPPAGADTAMCTCPLSCAA